MSQPTCTGKPRKESYNDGVVVDMNLEMYEVQDNDDDHATFSLSVRMWVTNMAVLEQSEGGGNYDTIQHLMDNTRPMKKLCNVYSSAQKSLPEQTGIVEIDKEFNPADVGIDTIDLFLYTADDTDGNEIESFTTPITQ
jgi:hypothetical protein